MRTHRSLFACAVCALLLSNFGLVSRALSAQPKQKVLIDFTSFPRDPDGTTFKPYEYAYENWNKHIADLRGRGTLIKAPNGKGGLGENKTAVDFAKATTVDLHFVIGEGNEASSLSFSLEDKDGSEHTWTIPLEGQPAGQLLSFRFNLTKPDNEQKPGKTPGMNLKKVSTWQVRGNWSDPKVEVLLVRLTAEK